jgi:tetratricopeptide (TPR) repeat protein
VRRILVVALLGAAAASAADKPKTIKDLQSRPVEVRKDVPVSSNSSKAMDNYRRFLELQKTDPQLRAEALRRLGDLNLEAGELERMEKEVGSIDLQGGEAIQLYTTLLKAYPKYPRNDQVLYQLARAYETTGQPEQALGTLDRIVRGYPGSSQMDEVQFRRGELLFSAKRYGEAEDAYAVAISRGPQSAFFEQSLYKHGWSLFKQSQIE